ncbi:R-spondin-3-like [Aulostomus maculatus]
MVPKVKESHRGGGLSLSSRSGLALIRHGQSFKLRGLHEGNLSGSRHCQAGCATCSTPNGCLSCKPRFFFHVELDGMRQKGTCLSLCPRGHYGTRSPHFNTCTRCKEDCASCFSENFCTNCHPGFFLFQGKCESSCPKGLTANTARHECTDCPVGCELCVRGNTCVRCRANLYSLHGQCYLTCPTGFEPDVQLKHCIPQVHYEVGQWTEWTLCIRKRSLRSYRKRRERHTREVLHSKSISGHPYTHVTGLRKCAIHKQLKLYQVTRF